MARNPGRTKKNGRPSLWPRLAVFLPSFLPSSLCFRLAIFLSRLSVGGSDLHAADFLQSQFPTICVGSGKIENILLADRQSSKVHHIHFEDVSGQLRMGDKSATRAVAGEPCDVCWQMSKSAGTTRTNTIAAASLTSQTATSRK